MEGSLVAYKVFSNGSVLNASEINDNLMNQSVMVFSNAAARTAAITSPVEGMVTFLEDQDLNNAIQVYDGSSYKPLGLTGSTGIPFRMAAGVITVNGSATLTFPASRFNTEPVLTFGTYNNFASVPASIVFSAVTATSVFIENFTITGASRNGLVSWHAIQMTSTSGAG
jgi:hypothetical protein